MILGRTTEGLIKIKKDDPLGLRAVNCACCDTCGCSTTISGDLLETLRNATTGTCNGFSPSSFYAEGGGFTALWFFPGPFGFLQYIASLSADVNCFQFVGSDFINEVGSGASEACCSTISPFPVTCADVIYTINGNSFVAHTTNSGVGEDIPAPTFIFS